MDAEVEAERMSGDKDQASWQGGAWQFSAENPEGAGLCQPVQASAACWGFAHTLWFFVPMTVSFGLFLHRRAQYTKQWRMLVKGRS